MVFGFKRNKKGKMKDPQNKSLATEPYKSTDQVAFEAAQKAFLESRLYNLTNGGEFLNPQVSAAGSSGAANSQTLQTYISGLGRPTPVAPEGCYYKYEGKDNAGYTLYDKTTGQKVRSDLAPTFVSLMDVTRVSNSGN